MPHYTKHQIKQFHEKYKEIDITFNKKVIEYTRFIPHEISFKVGNDNYSCIVNSSSMMGAHVILQADKIFFEKVKANNKWVSLRFAFRREDKSHPLTFFIKSKVKSFNPLQGKTQNLFIINIEFAQQPPDDYIEILGSLIDAGTNSKQRKHDRIDISNESMRLLHLESNNGIIYVNKKAVRCIIRDISLSGCKIIAKGDSQYFMNQPAIFAIKFSGEPEYTKIPGKILRTELIKENEDFLTIGIQFVENHIPNLFVRFVSDYFSKKE
ncbi:MAG: PilZ domain-containing protein [Spirochaetales bacterium]|nr:PilZ domain-containing protein [Spirochaetales bacterium]